MQLLLNASPGFRDVRAPLMAGYLWLLFAWLLARPNLSSRPRDALGAAAFDLGEYGGTQQR